MVKADATRNYYQDLGVSAIADENEIRRAFRQLALKFHPDRNPGREAEFVTKFQQIQAAHEVLSDPAQRIKYDNERRKFRALNIPPYNPTTPRARPQPPPRNPYTTTTPSGSYYRPPPQKPQPQPPPPPPPPPPHPPPPQRPPPPQHRASYTNGADRFTSKNFRAPPTAQRPDARAKEAEARANVFTAWQKMKPPRNDDPRAQKPYNPNSQNNPNNPNYANNPNGAPFGRSQSTRVPTSKKGFNPGTPGGDEGQARSAYRSNYERPAPSPPHTGDPLKHFKEQMEGDHVPYAEGNRMRTPYSSAAAGERTSMSGEGVGRSYSVRNSPTHSHRPRSSTDGGSYSDSGWKGQRNAYAGNTTKPFAHMYPSSSDEESEAEVYHSMSSKSRSRPSPKPAPKQEQKWGQGPFRAAPTGEPSNPKPDSTPNTFKSRSEESINMKFSPSDWHGKFEGKPDYFAPNMQKGTSSKGRTSPSRGRPSQRTAADRGQFSGQSQPPPVVSPFSQQQSSQMPPPPLNNQTTFPTGTHSTKFTEEVWTETFKEPSWALPSKTKDQSPRRGSVSTKRSKPAPRKPSAVPNGSANGDGQSENPRPKYQAFAEEAGNGDGDAMDIDSTPPVEKTSPLGAGARTTPTSPKNGQADGRGKTPNGNTTEPSSATRAEFSSGLDGLAGLANVAPFAPPSNGGLFGLDDLKDTLPFKSKASSAHPTKPNTAQKLKYPIVPVAPQVPSVLEEGPTLLYLQQMESYARQFKVYNKTMKEHFAGRDAELEDLDEHFISTRGETTKKLGFTSYLRKMKEDEKVLETWKFAQEMHLRALEKCEEVRNKTLKVYAFGHS